MTDTINELKHNFGVTVMDVDGCFETKDGEQAVQHIKRVLEFYGKPLVHAVVGHFQKQSMPFVALVSNDSSRYISGGELGCVIRHRFAGIGMGGLLDERWHTTTAKYDNVFAHEFGHLITYMIEETIGADKLDSDMVALSGGYPYDKENYKETFHIGRRSSIYFDEACAKSVDEDLAILFELFYEDPKEMVKVLKSYPELNQKSQYVKDILEQFVGEGIPLFAPMS